MRLHAPEIALDEMFNSPDEYAPGVDEWTMDSPAPLPSNDGRYPVPLPGIVTGQEYPM